MIQNVRRKLTALEKQLDMCGLISLHCIFVFIINVTRLKIHIVLISLYASQNDEEKVAALQDMPGLISL